MRWFYPLALLAVAGLTLTPFWLLSGESEGASVESVVTGWTPTGEPITNDKPVTLFDTYSAVIKSMDPATIGDVPGASLSANVFEGLYTYDFLKRPVSEETIVPQLADALPEISEDKCTYTIRLKKGVLYQRNPCFGTETIGETTRDKTREVTAHDFVLGFKRVADFHVNTHLSWAFLRGRIVGLDEYRKKTADRNVYEPEDFSRYDLPVEGIQALDDYTLQLKLTEPYPQFLLVLAMNSYAPIPREAIDYWLVGANPFLTEFRKPESLVGTGPYILKIWETKKLLLFVRNPDYRPEYYPTEGEPAHGDYPGDKAIGLLDDAGKRVPFIDVLRYDYMAQSYSAWMSFLAKRKDITGIPKETFDHIVTPGKDLVEQWKDKGIRLYSYSSPSVFWIAFNMDDPILGASKSLRQALCLVFDVENQIKVLYNGRGARATNTVPSSFAGHEAAGPGPYYVEQTRDNRDDLLRRAQAKLEDAKGELAVKGLLTPDNKIPKLKLEMTAGDRSVTYSQFVQQQFGKLGVQVEPIYNDWGTLQEKIHNKEAQMYAMGWHADYPDAENFLQLYYGPNIDNGTNNCNYNDPQFNEWYEQARSMFPGPDRMDLYVKMIRKLNEDVPVLLLSEPTSYVLYYRWLHNVKSHPIGYGYAKYRRIDAELRAEMGGRTE